MTTMPITRIEDDPTAEYSMNPERRPWVHVAFGGGTHPGHVRPRNEDQYLIAKLAKSMRICASSLPESETTRLSDEEGYLLIVADGMGGVLVGRKPAQWRCKRSSHSSSTPSSGFCTGKATIRTRWSMSFAWLSSVPTAMS